jgi:hypothetical protein
MVGLLFCRNALAKRRVSAEKGMRENTGFMPCRFVFARQASFPDIGRKYVRPSESTNRQVPPAGGKAVPTLIFLSGAKSREFVRLPGVSVQIPHQNSRRPVFHTRAPAFFFIYDFIYDFTFGVPAS